LLSLLLFATAVPAIRKSPLFLKASHLQKACPASTRFNKLHVQKPVRIAVDVSSRVCQITGMEAVSDSSVDPNLAAQLLIDIEISGHRSGTAERLTNSSCATGLMRASRHLGRVQLRPLLRGFGQSVRWYSKAE
jgi:hypothetical protein